MKTLPWNFFIGALLAAGCVCVACKQDARTATVTPTPADTSASDGIPTDAQIAHFMSRYQDPSDNNKVIIFNAKFGAIRFYTPDLQNDYRARGKIPFGIAAELVRQEKTGMWVNTYAIMDGLVDIVVLDADGKLVDRQKKDFASLCPS